MATNMSSIKNDIEFKGTVALTIKNCEATASLFVTVE